MKRRLVLAASFFGAVPIIIFCLILYSLFLLHNQTFSHTSKNMNLFTKSVHFKALPQDRPEMEVAVGSEDARILVLEDFFKRYKSPLLAYAEKIVSEADKNHLDYRLLTSIAMQESNLCKKIPKNSYNCWGFGIYGGKVKRFESYPHAIEAVSKSLSKQYAQKGLRDPHEIMTKYTPGSNGSWANSVTFFMERLDSSLSSL